MIGLACGIADVSACDLRCGRLTRIEEFCAFALVENGEAQNREAGLTDCFYRANNARGEVAMEGLHMRSTPAGMGRQPDRASRNFSLNCTIVLGAAP
jgi:hypothetical protein